MGLADRSSSTGIMQRVMDTSAATSATTWETLRTAYRVTAHRPGQGKAEGGRPHPTADVVDSLVVGCGELAEEHGCIGTARARPRCAPMHRAMWRSVGIGTKSARCLRPNAIRLKPKLKP
jgi:hypothetical protein